MSVKLSPAQIFAMTPYEWEVERLRSEAAPDRNRAIIIPGLSRSAPLPPPAGWVRYGGAWRDVIGGNIVIEGSDDDDACAPAGPLIEMRPCVGRAAGLYEAWTIRGAAWGVLAQGREDLAEQMEAGLARREAAADANDDAGVAVPARTVFVAWDRGGPFGATAAALCAKPSRTLALFVQAFGAVARTPCRRCELRHLASTLPDRDDRMRNVMRPFFECVTMPGLSAAGACANCMFDGPANCCKWADEDDDEEDDDEPRPSQAAKLRVGEKWDFAREKAVVEGIFKKLHPEWSNLARLAASMEASRQAQ